MVSLYAALAADALAFNSAYNRDSFVAGVAALLARLPDRVPPGVPRQLLDKALVLPVPIDMDVTPQVAASWPGERGDPGQRPLRLLWSGRFEHDKGGEGLYLLLQALEQQGCNYQLAVTGQQFRNSPPVFARIEQQFAGRLVHFGYVPVSYTHLRAHET